MQIDPKDYDGFYNVMKAVVVPRPIAFVSSVSETGEINLAPYSFFNAVCYDPPTIIVSIQRLTPDKPKDTLNNIEATGEFVVNVVNQDIAQAMNTTSAEYPSDMNEFEIANLTQIPSTVVKAPRVKESPVNLECKLKQVVEIGPKGKSYGLVIAEIIHMHIWDELIDGYHVKQEALNMVGRLGGHSYVNVARDEMFDMNMPVYAPEEVAE